MFFLFFCIWALPQGENVHCRLFKNWSPRKGIFDFDLSLWGSLIFFFTENDLSSRLFWKMQREVFARWSGDLFHIDEYERLKWPRKKILRSKKNLKNVPEKPSFQSEKNLTIVELYCQPEKQIKKVGEKFNNGREKCQKSGKKWARKPIFAREQSQNKAKKLLLAHFCRFSPKKKNIETPCVGSIYWECFYLSFRKQKIHPLPPIRNRPAYQLVGWVGGWMGGGRIYLFTLWAMLGRFFSRF